MAAAKPWPVPFWVYTAMTALGLVLVVLFVDETFYDRRIPTEAQPPRGTRIGRLLGVPQWQSRRLRNSFGEACMRSVRAILKPTVAISCLYYLLVSALPAPLCP